MTLHTFFNFVLIFLFFLLCCVLQTTLLPQILGTSQTLNIGLGFTVYMALFRPLPESLIWIYLSSFITSMVSACPPSFVLISQIIILFYVRFTSIFWKREVHFLMFYSSSIVLFYLNLYFLSLLSNLDLLIYPHWTFFFFQIVWALILGYPIYRLLKVIDDVSNRTSIIADDIL